jgi:hypothetical protein
MHDRFVAEVIDVFDPEESGRLKIRIFGLQDDTTRIPDDMLPWARCVFPVTNPVHDGVAGPTTGLVKGSIVVGYFADHAKQVPLITGSLGGVSGGNDVQFSGPSNQIKYDFPKADRGEDYNEVLNKNLPSIAILELKFVVDKTIGSVQYLGQDINQMLSEIEQGDIVGAIYSANDLLNSFNNFKNNIVNSTVDQVNGVVQAFASDIGATLQQETGVNSTELGFVINKIDSISGAVTNSENVPLTNTINDLAGNIATRTSKAPMNTVSDVLRRVNGCRFVMGNIMPKLEATLNSLEE